MAVPANTIKVAISSDFLDAFAQIPKSQQAKVRKFIELFKADPTAASINYEKIQDFKDPKLRSVRIDQAYRGIVLKPETGNVYMLLWVDHHDKAYQWAKNKVYHIHPETGSLQVIDAAEQVLEPSPAVVTEEEGLFSDIRDRHLARLGIPEALLPLVRSLKTEDDLDQVEAYLPQEAYEALFLLAAGSSVEEVEREMEWMRAAQEVDTDDFAAALDNPDSQRRFVVVEQDHELEEILNAPLEKWRVFLHPSQRKLVEMKAHGPVRVLGGAGTGKTVVAMHRARWLMQQVFTDENDRLLFTTFTRNLAADIQENLAKICPTETLRRIEVVNLDQWVSGFLRKQGYAYDIDYGDRTRELWEEALNLAPPALELPGSFYRDEWERVIQPQDVTTLSEYMRASRIGRGTPLHRKARKAIWPVFEEYRLLLDERGLRESEDAMRDARMLLQQKGAILAYRSIIVDEAQDMGAQAFKLIRQMVPEGPHDLFIVGDGHQRIYRHKVVLSHCGIDIRGRGRKLRINYRTTEENRRWAVGLLEGVPIDDLEGGLDDQKGYKSLLHGVMPSVKSFDSFKDEVAYLTHYLEQLPEDARKAVCLVARTNDYLHQYEGALKAQGLKTYFVRRSKAEDRRASGVRLATMHRVKGLEFDRVIIAGVNEGLMPYPEEAQRSQDPVIRQEAETRERALLYVAATRAKNEVLITSFGKPSRFL